METEIRNYLKEHLSIDIDEKSYGFNGKYISIMLKLDEEVISETSYTLVQDTD